MNVHFRCVCGKQLKAAEEYVGRRAKCTGCGAVLAIPHRDTTAPLPIVHVRTVSKTPSVSIAPRRRGLTTAWRRLHTPRLPSPQRALVGAGLLVLAASLVVGGFWLSGLAKGRQPAKNELVVAATSGTPNPHSTGSELSGPMSREPNSTRGRAPKDEKSKTDDNGTSSIPQAPGQSNATQEQAEQDGETSPGKPASSPSHSPAEHPPKGPGESSGWATTSFAAVHQAISDGVRLEGSIVFDQRTFYGYDRNTTYHQWKVDVKLRNATDLAIELGRDLFLIESNGDGSAYEGVAAFYGREASVTGVSSYGLGHNFEVLGESGEALAYLFSGNYVSVQFLHNAGPDFGSLSPGSDWPLQRTFEQGTWLRDELRQSVRLVLPELCVRTAEGKYKFRLTARFRKPRGRDSRWNLDSQELVPLRQERLRGLLLTPETNQVDKILAANWLAETYREQAVPHLVEASQPLREGQLLATCLVLLTTLNGRGLESHAIDLLRDPQFPNGVRGSAATYLAAVHHEPALELLITAARGNDNVVASRAIFALGTFGGARAGDALLALFRDQKFSGRHSEIASALARSKWPEGIRALEESAQNGNTDAMQALVQAGPPESFDFFVTMAGKLVRGEWRPKASWFEQDAGNMGAMGIHESKSAGKARDWVAQGLRACGGTKALPMLLQMLERDDPPAQNSPLETDELVRVLTDLDAPEATPRLVELACAGNLRAVQVLAGSANESVRGPLAEIAQSKAGTALHIALDGLRNHWAAASVDVFAKYLNHQDEQIVGIAIDGLRKSKNRRAAVLLLPLLTQPEVSLSRRAAWALCGIPLDDALPRIAEALFQADDGMLIDDLAKALILAGWDDRTAVPRLGHKLAQIRGGEPSAAPTYMGGMANMSDFEEQGRYPIVRLLRALSGETMGPKDRNEFDQDPEGWVRKWVDWARRQRKA